MGKFCLWFSKFSRDLVARIRAHQYEICFIKLWPNFFSVWAISSIDNYTDNHHSKFMSYISWCIVPFCTDWRCPCIARFSQISGVARKFCARLACWCSIISSNDILDWDMIRRQAVSVAQFFFSKIWISFFLIISKWGQSQLL